MRQQLCVCALTPSLSTSSSLTLLLHHEEAHKPTNSGALAARCLKNSRVVVVDPRVPFDLGAPTKQRLLLFPQEGARVLGAGDTDVELVVPDGTWRQARKMRARLPGLSELECVTLPTTTTTSWRLREERREHGLATLEAIAAAFAIVEGAAIADAMLAVFRVMVDRTLWLRGTLKDDEVSGGIPEAARLHDPRGGLPQSTGSPPSAASSSRS